MIAISGGEKMNLGEKRTILSKALTGMGFPKVTHRPSTDRGKIKNESVHELEKCVGAKCTQKVYLPLF
jgi:hypothetical protein